MILLRRIRQKAVDKSMSKKKFVQGTHDNFVKRGNWESINCDSTQKFMFLSM